MIRDLARTHHHLVTEEIYILHETQHRVIAECQRACRGKLTFALFHELHDSILDHLCVHLEAWNLRILAETIEHSVGNVADTGLDRQEFLGNLAVAKLGSKEVTYILTYTRSKLIGRRKGRYAFRSVRRHDTDYLFRIYLEDRRADTVVRFVDGDLSAVRRIQRNIIVVESAERVVIITAVLDDHLLCHLGDGGSHAETRTENDLAVGTHLRSLYDRYIDVSVEAIAQILRKMAQMKIRVMDAVAVDEFATVLVALIRHAHPYRVCP